MTVIRYNATGCGPTPIHGLIEDGFASMPFWVMMVITALWVVMPASTGASYSDEGAVNLLRNRATPLHGASDLDPLVAAIGHRRLVLLGESSHGTSEFYIWRTQISRRLIQEQGFRFIAVEGDWDSSYRLNRYVKGATAQGDSARSVMQGFSRWPTWMWANEEVVDLIEWLRSHNDNRAAAEQVGFYGLDLYGQSNSLRKVPEMLAQMAPVLSERAVEAYACLAPYGDDFSLYAQAAARGQLSCESSVRAVVAMLRQERPLAARDPDAYFNLKQHALVVKHAEGHYRAMAISGSQSWNVRADHFFLTTERLLTHYGEGAKGIVWAHNTHIGDARATAMVMRGQRNIGQIARERLGDGAVYAVGFGTHRGTVMAGSRWGAPAEVMTVPPAMPGSFEDLSHRTQMARFLLRFDDPAGFEPLTDPVGHRAIGVVYQPTRERPGNYVPSVMPRRYDAFIFLDQTRAVHPVE